jgi:hypothetical protein
MWACGERADLNNIKRPTVFGCEETSGRNVGKEEDHHE